MIMMNKLYLLLYLSIVLVVVESQKKFEITGDIVVSPYKDVSGTLTCTKCPFSVSLENGAVCKPVVSSASTWTALLDGVANLYYSFDYDKSEIKFYLVTLDNNLQPECNDEEIIVLNQKKTLVKEVTMPSNCKTNIDTKSIGSTVNCMCDFDKLQPASTCVATKSECDSQAQATTCNTAFVTNSNPITFYDGLSISFTATDCSAATKAQLSIFIILLNILACIYLLK